MKYHLFAVFYISFYFSKTAGIDSLIHDGSQTEPLVNRTQILSDFTILLKTEGAQTFHHEDLVLSKGTVSRDWLPSCRNSSLSANGSGCTVHKLGIYHERLVFEFLYSNPSIHKFKRPTLSSIGGRAQPVIADYFHDADEKSGEISIRHACAQGNSISSSQINFQMDIGGGVIVEMSWDKECGTGKNEALDYGWIAGTGDTRRPMSFKTRSPDNEIPVFRPRALNTRIYLLMNEGSQWFEDIDLKSQAVETNGDAVELTLRGGGNGGWIERSDVLLDVLYECHGRGVSIVSALMRVPPFDPVFMQWKKDCGGGPAAGVDVGTNPGAWGHTVVPNVVKSGFAVDGYRGMVNGTKADRKSAFKKTVIRHPRRSATRRFWLWAGEEEIGEVSAHTENNRIASAGGRLVGGTGVLQRIEIWTKCRRKGRTGVRVVVSVRDRDAIEWWFGESCGRNRMRNKGGPGVTAGAVVWWSMGLWGGVVLLWMRRMLTVSRRKYRGRQPLNRTPPSIESLV